MVMVGSGRARKASALLPLAVLSAAWTAGLATSGSGASASASADSQTLPDGSHVPAKAVKAPASLTRSSSVARGIQGRPHQVVATASASGIPTVALTAYQRAATVIDAADRSCHLPWQLVAAIGRVESDHGRAEGNVLTNRGMEDPGIYGPALDGRHGTALVRDTDSGQYDQDTTYDRAVGPMQFIPSTWAIVGVDADNDGQRNPQDIYDAALAAAVYLCSGSDDLSTASGRRSAVFRYNHSTRYVDLVLAIERAYQAGDFSAVPNATTTTGFTLGTPPLIGNALHHARHTSRHGHHHGRHSTHTTTGNQPTAAPTGGTTAAPTANPTGGLPTKVPTKLPTKLPTTLPTTLPTSVPTSVPTVLSKAEAVVKCLAKGLLEGTPDFEQCVYNLTH